MRITRAHASFIYAEKWLRRCKKVLFEGGVATLNYIVLLLSFNGLIIKAPNPIEFPFETNVSYYPVSYTEKSSHSINVICCLPFPERKLCKIVVVVVVRGKLHSVTFNGLNYEPYKKETNRFLFSYKGHKKGSSFSSTHLIYNSEALCSLHKIIWASLFIVGAFSGSLCQLIIHLTKAKNIYSSTLYYTCTTLESIYSHDTQEGSCPGM